MSRIIWMAPYKENEWQIFFIKRVFILIFLKRVCSNNTKKFLYFCHMSYVLFFLILFQTYRNLTFFSIELTVWRKKKLFFVGRNFVELMKLDLCLKCFYPKIARRFSLVKKVAFFCILKYFCFLCCFTIRFWKLYCFYLI